MPSTVQLQVAGQVVTSSNRLPVTTAYAQTASAPSSAAILTPTTGDTVVTTVAGQKAFVQNSGVNILYVKKGAGASTTSHHYQLPPGLANDDGFGGSVSIDDFIGPVSVAGTSPRCLARTE